VAVSGLVVNVLQWAVTEGSKVGISLTWTRHDSQEGE
jgi:hypothetical protein